MLTRQNKVSIHKLQCLQGRLIHASYGIPNRKGLLSPFTTLVTKHKHTPCTHIPLNPATRQALLDWWHILCMATKDPTPCTDLIPTSPDFIGYCDASKHGTGRVWFGATQNLPPIVWCTKFPLAIQQSLISTTNPHGAISNSNLEMAGLLLHWMVLKSLADLHHAHVTAHCNNLPMVAWTSHLISSKDTVTAHLLHALTLHMLTCQASPLTPFHLPGTANQMTDFASCSFTTLPKNHAFLTKFPSLFPLPQDVLWHLFQPHSSTTGKVFSALQTTMLPMVWWLQTTSKGNLTGATGSNLCWPMLICTFKAFIAMTKCPSYKPSLSGPDRETWAEDTRSKPEPSKMPSLQLARPSNWMASQTCSTPRFQQVPHLNCLTTQSPPAL